MRRNFYIILLLLISSSALAFNFADLWQRRDQQGASAMREGKIKQAAKLFKNSQWQGVANYRAKNYQKAVNDFAKHNSPIANYNRGNALAKLGQYHEAIAAYEKALKQQPSFPDAKFNRDLLKKFLKQPPKKKKQKQQAKNHNNQQQKSSQTQQTKNRNKNKNQKQQQPQQQTGNKQKKHAQQQSSPKQQQNKSQTKQQSQAKKQRQQMQQQNQTQAKQQQQAKQQNQQMHQQNAQQQNRQRRAQQQLSSPDYNMHQTTQRQAQQRMNEQKQASKQWLRQIPDDPGGLLREKFLRDHIRRMRRENNRNF